MSEKIDLTGKRFGRYTVVECVGSSLISKSLLWKCRCDCGNERTVNGSALRWKGLKSCGCGNNRFRTHGMSDSREYRQWTGARNRCGNPKHHQYHNYGARGIQMCAEWKASFSAFIRDMGRCPPGLTLERKDVNGNYEPKNCKWATHLEQLNNKRNTVRVTHEGKDTSLLRFCLDTGNLKHYNAIRRRLDHGLTLQQALAMPFIHGGFARWQFHKS